MARLLVSLHRENLDDIGDVTITEPSDNETLAYDSGSSKFINQTPAEAGLLPDAADVIDSDHFVDGGIDTEHLAADCVDGSKIADDAVGSGHIGENAIGAEHIDETDTDITLSQVTLTPKATGDGEVEGTVFYDSDDNHLYVYVV